MQEAAKATSKEELQRLQGALDAAQQLTRDTQQQLAAQQSQSSGLQQQLREQADRMERLQQQLQTATGDTSTLQKELSKKVQKLDALQGEKNALQVRASRLYGPQQRESLHLLQSLCCRNGLPSNSLCCRPGLLCSQPDGGLLWCVASAAPINSRQQGTGHKHQLKPAQTLVPTPPVPAVHLCWLISCMPPSNPMMHVCCTHVHI
jgi:hypothetical protein